MQNSINIKLKNFIKKFCHAAQHFSRVTKEFLITLFFSLVPILISSIAEASWSEETFVSSFIGNFRSGEVFIYTAAFLAPYIVNRLKEGTEKLFKEICFYLFWGALLTGAYLFLNLRIEGLVGMQMKISESTLKSASLFVVIATLFIWYYSIWPNHIKMSETDSSKKNEKEIEKMNAELTKRLGS